MRVKLGDAALKFPFVAFVAPVALTAFPCDSRPSIAAATLAGVIANLVLIRASGSMPHTWPDGWIAVG